METTTRVREGDVLQGKYRVERVLGVGGMGVVVAAHHLHLDQKVAIKSLLPEGLGHPEALLRFEREARAAVRIKSEHIARVLDVARFDDGSPYLVMEYLDGSDLSKRLQERGPLSIEEALHFIVQACEAIAEAHTLGIVHRDIKPANLFVIKDRDGRLKVKVLDFGISKSAESWSGPAAVTRTHAILGSPEYMSPEQLTAPKTVDWRTDIWSLGVTLFELLAGHVPFTGNELVDLAVKITQQPAPSISVVRRDVPAGLASVILRCLEKDRAARYRDVAELVAALAPFAPRSAHALVERISRIVNAGRTPALDATALDATALAETLPVGGPATELRTQGATSWPSEHPVAGGTPTTRGVVMPTARSIPAPRPKARHERLVMALGVAVGAIVMFGVSAARWRGPSEALAAPHHAAQPSSAAASSASSVAPPAELPSEPAVAIPAPVLPSASAPKASANDAAFRGTRAVTRATWRFGADVYHGVIHTNGTTGHADVQAIEPGFGPVVIREDLRLQQGSRGWTYVGSNPRYVDTGERADFFPNAFTMERGAGGAWTFGETCAIGTGMCTRVVSEK